ALPGPVQAERLLGRLEERLDVDREVRLVEPDGFLVGTDEVILVAPLAWVEDAPYRAQEDRQTIPQRPGALAGPERLHQRLARSRSAAPRDEDLEQIARLARLPCPERHGLAGEEHAESPERLDDDRRDAGQRVDERDRRPVALRAHLRERRLGAPGRLVVAGEQRAHHRR